MSEKEWQKPNQQKKGNLEVVKIMQDEKSRKKNLSLIFPERKEDNEFMKQD